MTVINSNSQMIGHFTYYILPCIMCTFCQNFSGKNKDIQYTWVVLKHVWALSMAKYNNYSFQ